jgi:nicotinamide-nucleotide amidase
MRCEVVAIGTELLLGVIVDTNSAWIGEQLALAGIDSVYQVKVGDNFQRIEAAIRQALDRSEAVICCGGLGPTQDDITRDVIAKVMGVEMGRDEAMAEHIRKLFEARGRTMSPNNLRQADRPAGADFIKEMPGTAPGLVCKVGDKVIYAVPGVPREMKEMVSGTVIPDLRRRAGESSVIRSRTIRTWGLSESRIDELLTDRMAVLDKTGNPTIAFQASGIDGIKVRLVAKCDTEAAAKALLDAEEREVRAVLGDAVFGLDEQSMEHVVLDLAKARGLTIAAAETITGGVLASRMTMVDPQMIVFKGATIGRAATEAGVSLETEAKAAARQAALSLGANVGLAAIDAAGREGHAPGAVVLAVTMTGSEQAEVFKFPGDRIRLREYSVISLLDLLRRQLLASG